MGTLHRSCAKVRDPSELRLGLMHALDRGTAVLHQSPRHARKRGGLGDCSQTFTIETRSPAVAEGPHERAVSRNLVKYCTNVRQIALEKVYNRGMTFKVIQGH